MGRGGAPSSVPDAWAKSRVLSGQTAASHAAKGRSQGLPAFPPCFVEAACGPSPRLPDGERIPTPPAPHPPTPPPDGDPTPPPAASCPQARPSVLPGPGRRTGGSRRALGPAGGPAVGTRERAVPLPVGDAQGGRGRAAGGRVDAGPDAAARRGPKLEWGSAHRLPSG